MGVQKLVASPGIKHQWDMYSVWNYKAEDILPPNSTNPPGPTSTKLYSPQLKSTPKQIQHILIMSVFNIICFCLFVKWVVYHRFSVRRAYSLWDILVECCFTSTETVGLLGTGAQDSHPDFHTASELCLWDMHKVSWYSFLIFASFCLFVSL